MTQALLFGGPRRAALLIFQNDPADAGTAMLARGLLDIVRLDLENEVAGGCVVANWVIWLALLWWLGQNCLGRQSQFHPDELP